MRVKQLIYPFLETIVSAKYLQIGIERPHNIPIELPYEPYQIAIRINSNTYSITDKEILEFSDISGTSTVQVLDTNNPYLIIDLAYETAD